MKEQIKKLIENKPKEFMESLIKKLNEIKSEKLNTLKEGKARTYLDDKGETSSQAKMVADNTVEINKDCNDSPKDKDEDSFLDDEESLNEEFGDSHEAYAKVLSGKELENFFSHIYHKVSRPKTGSKKDRVIAVIKDRIDQYTQQLADLMDDAKNKKYADDLANIKLDIKTASNYLANFKGALNLAKQMKESVDLNEGVVDSLKTGIEKKLNAIEVTFDNGRKTKISSTDAKILISKLDNMTDDSKKELFVSALNRRPESFMIALDKVLNENNK